MSHTTLNKKERELEVELTDKQKMFCQYYLVNYNGTEAAKKASYKSPGAAAANLLTIPKVQRYLRHYQKQLHDKLKLSQEAILLELYYLCTRTTDDFVDDDGKIITDLSKLTERAKHSIDGLEQECWTDNDGNQHIKNKLRLVPKATALDLAMKNKGMFAPVKSEATVTTIDFSKLYGKPPGALDNDVIEDPDEPRKLEQSNPNILEIT